MSCTPYTGQEMNWECCMNQDINMGMLHTPTRARTRTSPCYTTRACCTPCMRQDMTLEPLVALNALSARHVPVLFPVQAHKNSPLPRRDRWAFSGQFTGAVRAAPAPPSGHGRHQPRATGAACGTRTLRTSRGRTRPRATPGTRGRPGRATEVRPPAQPGGPRPSRRPCPPHLRAGSAGAQPRSAAGPRGDTARPAPPPCPRCPPAAPDDDVTGQRRGVPRARAARDARAVTSACP